MKWTGLNELREEFLQFFESKGHLRLESFPLVPQSEPTLLLINSGMAPLKNFFMGIETPPSKRVTTCQKCIRTPDIERVGQTSRHGTYFEMLGNFSFGDYFKKDATKWAWEFVVEKMEMPIDRLWISIYEEDDETFDIWVNEIGVDPERIVRLGKEDNFWEIGAGPCGPCSEIYFDRGEEHGCGSPDCKVGCDCDRFVEFWNLVFTQFNNDGHGNYTPLEHKNIDTGMGLERLACIMQGVDNLFEVDTIQNIMKHVSEIADVHYKKDEKTDVSLRVITDHIRSTVFMLSDGVMPSNEGRGYVLRRLLRRAARHGRLLGIDHPFLHEVCSTVIKENLSAYPELKEKEEYIKKIVLSEEESFGKTIDKGISLLNQLIDHAEKIKSMISGEEAFRLYDTFGFPLDLTQEILSERGIKLDVEGFRQLMEMQRERARAASSLIAAEGWSEGMDLGDKETEFHGYFTMSEVATITEIAGSPEPVAVLSEGEQGSIILDHTPFYAESGGQVSDTGVIKSETGLFTVTSVKEAIGGIYLHRGVMTTGELKPGDQVDAVVDEDRRKAIMRNHTAAHLLQAALREVLGTHVHQAGQLVDENRVRFDFSHFNAMTPEEITAVEHRVNQIILAGLDVAVKEMDLGKAREEGALALFSEKYNSTVRVCSVDGFSKEFCGGTHVDNTAKLGLFKIESETSVAAGVRRIEGVTGFGVLKLLDDTEKTISRSAEIVKVTNKSEFLGRLESLMTELRKKEKELDKLEQGLAKSQVDSLLENTVDVNGIKFISAGFTTVKVNTLRTMGDFIKDKLPDAVAVLSCVDGEKGNIYVVAGKEAVERGVHAGNLVRDIAKLAGGSGGGRPDSAMAGVKDIYKIDEAVAKATDFLKAMVK